MGIDVTHPGPGSCETAPSVAGIVATIDDKFAQYRGEILIQERRQEMVTGLKGPAVNLLTRWRAANGRLPRNILVYRDGVSEGQFGKVLEVELPEMEKAFTELYGKQQDWPNLSITVSLSRLL